MDRALSWTKQELGNAVETSYSFRQVLQKINLRPAGGNYIHIQKRIKLYGFDTSHFKGRGWNRGLKGTGIPRIPLEKLLVKGSSFQSFKLKKRLFAANLKPQQCEQCGWAMKSEDGYLPLELDHINGDRTDNRLINLRVLCPNCHSLTHTYRSRRRN